ncbi:hypothetical protein RAS2_01450 [Phycisphaerae bacterium RAS2]|nr:hypothetical protein RAS2_01450 [Phycisphaerae bacterium RAS2]
MSEFTPNDSGAATEIDTIREPGARSRGGVVGWMSRHPVILAVLGLLVVLALGVFAFSRNAENRYQKMIREIRARGEPTTVEELIAATPGLPDEENALLRVLDAWREIEAVKLTDVQNGILPVIGVGKHSRTGTKLTNDQLAAISSYLASIQEPLARLETSLASGRGDYRPMLATPMHKTSLPELGQIRGASKVLAVGAIDAAAKGHRDRAAELLHRMVQLCQMLDGKRTQISAMVKLSVVTLTHDQIERAINSSTFSDESLRRIMHSVESINLNELLRDTFIAERVGYIDTIAWLETAPGGVAGVYLPTGVTRHLPGLAALSSADGMSAYGELIDAAVAPTGEALRKIDAIVIRSQQLPWYSFVAKVIMPSQRSAAVSWVRVVGQQRALVTAIACERYRLKHGKWPEKLDALVPDYFDAVPLDPFDEKPIRFARIPEGFKVWSIGEDFVDNGGDVRRLDPDPKKRPTDWGWVILDPPLRNRSADATATTRPAGP